MKKCKWIIENFTDSEDYRDLIQAAKDSGREVFAIDKRNHSDFDPSFFSLGDCVIFQGSIQMTRNVRERLPANCFPISYNTWSNFMCSVYYPRLNNYLFNDKHEFIKLKDLQVNKWAYYEKFGKDAMIFVRPDGGDKSFTGQLVDLQDFDRFWVGTMCGHAEPDDIIIVTTPKNFIGEWRFVCSKYNGGEIIAQSSYNYQGKRTYIPSAPVKATELVNTILADLTIQNWSPDSIFCLDIVQDMDGNFWLMELTSFSSAGLYAANKNSIVKRVNEIVEMEYDKRLSTLQLVS